MAIYFMRFGAALISLSYVTISLAWRAWSNHFDETLSESGAGFAFLHSPGDTAFVLASGTGLYFVLRLYKRILTSRAQDTETRQQTNIDVSPALVLVVDPVTAALVRVNDAAHRYFGAGANSCTGLTLFDLLWPGRPPCRALEASVGRNLTEAVSQTASTAEWTVTDQSGRETVYAAGLTPVTFNGRLLVQITLADVTAPRILASVLRQLGAGLADKTGVEFHESLARSLIGALGVDHAFIAQVEPGHAGSIRTTARISVDGAAEAVAFERAGTLTGEVLDRNRPVISNDIAPHSPDFEQLGDSGKSSYAGVPLIGSTGDVFGVLAVMQSRPFRDEPLVLDVLALAAGRAAAELERMRTEAALAASEERFRQFATISSDWLWEQDEQFRFTYLSERWHSAGHRPMSEMIGRPRWQFANVDVEQDENWIRHRKTLEARETFSGFAYTVSLPDGSVRHCRSSGTPIFDPDGRFVGYRGSTTDETEKVEALRRAEQAQARLLDAIESLPLGFALFDRDDRLAIINERYRRRGGDVEMPYAVGIGFEELIRRAFAISPLHPSMGDPNAFCRERLARHRNLPSQQELQFANGRWIELFEYATREGETVLLWNDITTRKSMEAEVRNNEERFRSMISEASQGILVYREMKPLYCNSAFASMFGFDSVQAVLELESILPLISKEDRERLVGFGNAQQQGKAAPDQYEFTGIRRDDRKIEIRNRAVRITWDGEPAICTNMFDISERKAVEAALARSEGEFRDLVEGSVQGVVIHTKGELRFANKAAAQIFGYDTAEELLQLRTITDLFRKRAGTSAEPATDPGTVDGSMFDAEYRRRDGSAVWLEVLARDVDWQGDRSTQITMIDVTSRKRADIALRRSQRLKSIGQLTGGIAHDFNNLLAIVMGNLEFLRRQVDRDPKAIARVEAALKATRRGGKLVRRLLGFASQDVRPGTPTSANHVLNNLHDILSRSLTSEITLEIHTEPELWPTEIDPGELEDALLNLVLNARDAMPRGGHLVIETANRTVESGWMGAGTAGFEVEPGDYVVVSVSDDGIGMPPEHLERILEPFFTTKATDRGTGLGLSMVYGFAQRSRGDMRIYSEVDHGTTVRLFLPRSTADETAVTPDIDDETLPVGSETILLVDDESDLLEIAEHMLRDLGYRTLTARNGQDALAVLADPSGPAIDMVFSDVIMPGGISGFDLADRIGEMHPGTRVLLASGFSGRLVARNKGNAAEHAILHKPYDRSMLAHSIRQAITGTPSKPEQCES